MENSLPSIYVIIGGTGGGGRERERGQERVRKRKDTEEKIILQFVLLVQG